MDIMAALVELELDDVDGIALLLEEELDVSVVVDPVSLLPQAARPSVTVAVRAKRVPMRFMVSFSCCVW
nr:hypothetical protein [Kineococcus siccus]